MKCTFVLALPRSALSALGIVEERVGKILSHFPRLRVATKFPNVTSKYLQSLGFRLKLFPFTAILSWHRWVGLSEAIVDIVSTGKTLRNDLVPVDDF